MAAATTRSVPAESRRIMMFTRHPEPGRAKTRLIDALGAEGAANLHRELAGYTLLQLRRFGAASIEVWYTGADEPAMRDWLGVETAYRQQDDGDLGRRMSLAFESAFASGVVHALVVGSDCPDLGPETLHAAFDALGSHHAVLGPALDGGYYLLGLRRDAWPRASDLFENVTWGTDRVFRETCDRAASANITVALTAPLADIDVPADLEFYTRAKTPTAERPYLSVIVPTKNAGDRLNETLRSVGHPSDVEVIVVDGGSTDGTVDRAREFGARIVLSPPGRARQINRATAFASGEVLLFLHSDTALPEGYADEIRRTLNTPGTVLGAFRFATDRPSRAMRIVGWWTNLRARRLQLPYGDQGLFIRTADFRRLGGFRDLPIMDDFDFVVRARQLGRIACAASSAITSGDRWKRLGVLRTTLRNQAVVALYYAGASPGWLAKFYRRGMNK